MARSPEPAVPAVACALAALFAACGPATEGGPAPGILLIAVDALRSDHVSHLGYDRPTTPALDELAAGGVSFAQCFSSAPQLLPAHIALLTGCDPSVSRRIFPAEISAPDEKRWRVPDLIPRLAVSFLEQGYATGAFVDHQKLAPVYGLGPGFQRYSIFGTWPDHGRTDAGAATLSSRFLQWLRGVEDDRPWFAYLHFNDLERLWASPDPAWESYFEDRPELDEVPPVAMTDLILHAIPRSRWRGGTRTIGEYEAMYDGHLRRLDEQLGRLFGSLAVSGRLEQTTVVVVGTHGLQFGESGLYLTSGLYSMADLHVPWIVRPAASIELAGERGRELSALASLVDVAPTLLELSGIEPPDGMHGISQAGLIMGEGAGAPGRELAFATCGLQEGCVIVGERYCLEYISRDRVVDKRLRLSMLGEEERDDQTAERRVRFYDRQVDPNPPLRKGRVPVDRELYQEYKEKANRWLIRMKRTREVLQKGRELRYDPHLDATVSELRELGYLGSDFPWPPR